MKKIFATNEDVTLTLLRVMGGFVVLMHGFQKMFGWFGGHGPLATMTAFEQWFGLPMWLTFLVILSDPAGAFCLILGLGTRIFSACITMVMVGAIALVHGRWGFYMNWYGEPRGEGFEFHLLIIAIMTVLVIRGGGKFSLDRLVVQRFFETSRQVG